MTKQSYQALALLSLPVPLTGAYLLGRPFAAFLGGLDADLATTLQLLGYLLSLLLVLTVWAVVLAPLRAKAGFVPITQDVAQIRTEGLGAAVGRERQRLERQGQSDDPKVQAEHHHLMALVAGLFSLGIGALAWALYLDQYLAPMLIAAAVVLPCNCVYHLIQWYRFTRRARQQSAKR